MEYTKRSELKSFIMSGPTYEEIEEYCRINSMEIDEYTMEERFFDRDTGKPLYTEMEE